MPVPERITVDNALREAKKWANEIPGDSPFASLALVAYYCTEALVHQIRDADDTQATYLGDEILKPRLDDLTRVLGDTLGPIAHALSSAGEKKRGLLG